MKTLQLDMSKWRCGSTSSNSENALGQGVTYMLNELGYMCCLGQFAPQLEPRIKEEDLKGRKSPVMLGKRIPLLTNYSSKASVNTHFTEAAIRINDNRDTSILEKLDMLKTLLSEHDYQLEIINPI